MRFVALAARQLHPLGEHLREHAVARRSRAQRDHEEERAAEQAGQQVRRLGELDLRRPAACTRHVPPASPGSARSPSIATISPRSMHARICSTVPIESVRDLDHAQLQRAGESCRNNVVDARRVAREHQHVHDAAVAIGERAQRVEAAEVRADHDRAAAGREQAVVVLDARPPRSAKSPLAAEPQHQAVEDRERERAQVEEARDRVRRDGRAPRRPPEARPRAADRRATPRVRTGSSGRSRSRCRGSRPARAGARRSGRTRPAGAAPTASRARAPRSIVWPRSLVRCSSQQVVLEDAPDGAHAVAPADLLALVVGAARVGDARPRRSGSRASRPSP